MTEEGSSPPSDANGERSSYGPFAYLAAPNAPLYRRVMRVLMAEKERVTVHVLPEQVHAGLTADGGGAVTETAIAEALEKLSDPSWGNLLAFPDSSRVTAVEDFYRRRLLFQMSRPGEAAERALAAYGASLGTRGSLQSVALEDIVVLLTALRDAVTAHAGGGEHRRCGDPPDAPQLARAVRGAGRERRGVHGVDPAHHRPPRRRRRGLPGLQGAADRLPRAVHQRPAHPGRGDRRAAQQHPRRRRRVPGGHGRGTRATDAAPGEAETAFAAAREHDVSRTRDRHLRPSVCHDLEDGGVLAHVDDRAALADGTHARRLAGSAAGSPWDPGLAVEMAARGVAVEEEAVAAMLADDVVGVARLPA